MTPVATVLIYFLSNILDSTQDDIVIYKITLRFAGLYIL